MCIPRELMSSQSDRSVRGLRGVRRLSALPHLEVLRVGGTAAITDSIAADFAQRVRLESPSNRRIWWMLES